MSEHKLDAFLTRLETKLDKFDERLDRMELAAAKAATANEAHLQKDEEAWASVKKMEETLSSAVTWPGLAKISGGIGGLLAAIKGYLALSGK